MQSQSGRAAILFCVLLAIAAWPAVSMAQGDSSGPVPFRQAYERAQELFDRGEYAQVCRLLGPYLGPGAAELSRKEAARAKQLADRAEGVMIDRYDAVLAARQRAEAEAASRAAAVAEARARQDGLLAEADRLVGEAAGQDADKLRRALDLQIEVASERAAGAFDRAVEYFEQGKYDQAGVAFEGLRRWSEQQAALDAERKPALDEAREKKVAEYLAEIPVAKANLEEAKALIEQREARSVAQAESEKKFREAMREFDAAVTAFNHAEYAQAENGFNAVLASGADLGAKDAETRDYLARIASARDENGRTRESAAAWMAAAEGLLADNDWRAAGNFLDQTAKVEEQLADEQRVKFADLLAKADALRQAEAQASVAENGRGEMDRPALERANAYLEQVRRQRAILEEQRAATAREYLQIAKADYNNLNYDSALENVNQALSYQPDNEEARALKLEIEALLGNQAAVRATYGPKVSADISARLDEVRGEMDLAVQRGRIALDDERYDDAVKQFSQAQETVDYLRPYYDVAGVESEIRGLIARARAGQQAAAEKLEQERYIRGQAAAEDQARSERVRMQQQKVALLSEAHAEFARGKYESAMALADRILEVDPGNAVASDLKYDAREAQRARTWSDVYATDKRNREDERLKLREKLIWPAAVIQYPAKEVWAEITARTGVELPSAKAVKTPKELQLEAMLDTELAVATLPGVTLQEAVEILKTMLGEEVNFLIDPNIFEGFDILIQLELKNVSLRTALNHMLRPKGMNFIISDGAIFISSVEGCRLEEAREENLSFRQYDVNDLLISLDLTAGGGGAATASASGDDLIQLILRFTGEENWEEAGSTAGTGAAAGGVGGATPLGGAAGGGAYGGGAYGGGASGFGGGAGTPYGAGAGGVDEFGEATGGGMGIGGGFGAYITEGAGRTLWLRQGYLMVNHVDRIHKRIEELLAELRSQVTNQVKVEARVITFNDEFSKDIGVDWQGLTFDSARIGRFPAAHWTGSLRPTTPVAVTSALTLDVAFLSPLGATAVIHAAKNSSHATLVSSPHLTVLNGQEQTIDFTLSGTYVSNYTVQNNIAVPVITPYDISVINLTVRPVISADRRYVTMTLNIDVTSSSLLPNITVIPVAGGLTAAGTGVITTINTLQENSTTLETLCRVPDRGTLILAGLATLGETTGQGSVPILAHIPILKRLFTRNAVEKTRTHVVTLVTPTIILNEEVEP